MLPCYQWCTNCNEKKRNATKSEMQSNAKHEFECFKGQGAEIMTNRDRFDKMIKKWRGWIWNQIENNID
jgi:hypothetical protein